MKNWNILSQKRQSAVTLIELLLVIAIIAIITGLIFVVFGNPQPEARDSRKISELGTLKTALEQYYEKEGNYPNWTESKSASGAIITNSTDVGELGVLVNEGYISNLPNDPSYIYKTTNSGKNFKAFISMESEEGKKQASIDGGECLRHAHLAD